MPLHLCRSIQVLGKQACFSLSEYSIWSWTIRTISYGPLAVEPYGPHAVEPYAAGPYDVVHCLASPSMWWIRGPMGGAWDVAQR